MRWAIGIALLLAALVVLRGVDFTDRLLSRDLVALAFAEGGDDAYYFFTVARNIAAGRGITVDGLHWTTGFQPLWMAICALAFTLAGDRGALALLYAASFALWLGGAWLAIRFVRNARNGEVAPLAVALVAVLFLCEGQFAQNYFNGMETGLSITLCLGLLIAFQRHLQGAPAGAARLARLGVLCGLAMLARNDNVFLCGALLGALLISRTRAKPLREILIIGTFASLLVLPWIAYCQWATGHPMPQSGIATSAALRGHAEADTVAWKLLLSVVPLVVLKLRMLIVEHVAVSAAVVLAAALACRLVWRRTGGPALDRGTRWTLLALAAACVMVLAYYSAFSSAVQFFERYFSPIKLLVLLLLSLLIARLVPRLRLPASGVVATLLAAMAIGSNAYWTWRDIGQPFRGYLGETAFVMMRSAIAEGNTRLGFAESGRIGFLYPDRVVNLDGKMRVDVLAALRDGSFARFVQSAGLDYIVLHGFDVDFFDKVAPGWRNGYVRLGNLASFEVYARRR
jgi:4-amino-4-deoxy-L-arabinose transferase-like glycosyltransferase